MDLGTKSVDLVGSKGHGGLRGSGIRLRGHGSGGQGVTVRRRHSIWYRDDCGLAVEARMRVFCSSLFLSCAMRLSATVTDSNTIGKGRDPNPAAQLCVDMDHIPTQAEKGEHECQ